MFNKILLKDFHIIIHNGDKFGVIFFHGIIIAEIISLCESKILFCFQDIDKFTVMVFF